MTIHEYQERFSRQLLAWSIFSVLLGAWLARSARPLRRAVGQQFAVWGAIDGAIGAFGFASARRGRRRATSPDEQAKTRRRLTRILWINAGLDLLYVAAGIWLLGPGRRGKRDRAGHGVGVAVQGAFLLLFDLFHGLGLPRAVPVPDRGVRDESG